MKPRPHRCRIAWLLFLLLACALPAQALQFDADESGLTREEAEASRALLAATVQRLPARWTQALDRVRVEWRDDLPAHVHGRAIGRRILLRRALLEAGRTGFSGEDAASRAAFAAVIHELAHLYDRAPHGRLSRDPRLLDLAGWQRAALRPGRTRNAFTDRSPDAYELTSPAEFVAVNLEHFLLDADYACRRPALARYFAARLDTVPDMSPCARELPFVQADGTDADPLLQLDPGRVYAVDYLLAEGNEQAMSRWGHSMLRLVVCAPGRPRGPDCRLDLAYHRVLSFRAFVDDVQISGWRGLAGSYPSRLFLLPLDQVIDEYNRIELRGLQSLPLRLQPDEIATLLERAAQLHWSYDGRYWFVSNNCAVETWRLLHDGVPRLARERLSAITPTGLLRRLVRAGIADTSVLDDRAEAARLGYYFESAASRYQAMFDIARTALGLSQTNVHAWLDLPPRQRAPVIAHADMRSSAALLLLEQAALRREELRARDELKHRLLGRGARDDAGRQARSATQDLLALENLLSRPALLLPDGYGLPQRDELDAVSRRSGDLAAQSKQEREALFAQARRWLPPQTQAMLADTEANLRQLGDRLRQLHREQGGVGLP
ncbi:DUF4105 domain-containing protein [Lysobacter yangpyeongensis]|uniref:DUF4105 domain-containing protein n=1 Tax=Lysobacter yangpyeongensis TaxID=346182 RepID=A0ABW0SI96_9GAMM